MGRGTWMGVMEGSFQYLNSRRKHVRVPYPCQLEYRLESQPSQKLNAYVVNLSLEGVCLLLPGKLSVGQEITVDSSILPFLRSTCRVRWAKENSDGNYMSGLEFCLPSK